MMEMQFRGCTVGQVGYGDGMEGSLPLIVCLASYLLEAFFQTKNTKLKLFLVNIFCY